MDVPTFGRRVRLKGQSAWHPHGDRHIPALPAGQGLPLRYDLTIVHHGQHIWALTGIKSHVGHGPIARYRASTRVVFDVQSADGATAFRAHLRILPQDVLRNGLSIRGTGFTLTRRRRALLRFCVVFTRGLLARRISQRKEL
ncbi:hypothetical protein [Microbacterium sp. SORGH_AS_0888]|uniref:hypothetical protein n=1 Tax=Microbacterium sp. SORGH_AS_0888 TaxID=3041791 RepID=UPI0027840BA6|nr:hypothetical protein [Microbacterium sp. SORGH_AS_0888]MDQ1130885.1 hypothetical protein [Microbacterium sp. SORGH_AS_0888]